MLPTLAGDQPQARVRLLEAGAEVGAEIAGPRRTTRWWFVPGRLGARVEVLENGRTRSREIVPGGSPAGNITD